MQVGDLVRFSDKGNRLVGIVTEVCYGKYLVITDFDGQRYSMSQAYVEVLNVLV